MNNMKTKSTDIEFLSVNSEIFFILRSSLNNLFNPKINKNGS